MNGMLRRAVQAPAHLRLASLFGGRWPHVPLRLRLLLIVAALLILSACGGGGACTPVETAPGNAGEPPVIACAEDPPARTPVPRAPDCATHPEICS